MELEVMQEKHQTFLDKDEKQLVFKQVQDLRSSIDTLQVENDLFESFISRLEPLDLVSQTGEEGPGPGPGPAGGSQLENIGFGWRRRSRNSISDRLKQLSFEQKLYVVNKEGTETQHDHENLKHRYERMQDNYKASLKESELRLAEIRRAKKEFESRVVKPVKENRLEVKEPEKVLQFIADKLKITQLGKLNLMIQALKMQERKIQQQLHRQKELGKSDYEEIFPEYSERRTEKSRDELQVSNLKVQRVLSSHKEKLQSVTEMSAELSSDITNRKQMLLKIEEEIQHVQEECLMAEALNQQLQRQMAEYQVPGVNDYMEAKDKKKKLQQSVHTWGRKVGVAEVHQQLYFSSSSLVNRYL
uniref:Cilia- and flagella-associated protein 263 n=1 Tax=Cynoglossus semilaevis TaxID=244447 RepID=A0A3P8VJB5_CYNSE